MKTKQKKHYRGHGRGTLIQQTSGLYLAKWTFAGKTYVRSTKTHDRDEAEKKLDEFVKPFLEKDEIAVQQNILAKIRTVEVRHENEEQKKVSQTLVKDLFDVYIQTQGDNTISDQPTVCYQSYVRQYVKWLNENFEKVTTIGQVTKEMNQKFQQFRESLKKMLRRGKDIEKLNTVVSMLARGETLPPRYKDHALSGDLTGLRDCHIENNWILLYYIEHNVLVLTLSDTGTHSDLF